jgi:hypothetical protein
MCCAHDPVAGVKTVPAEQLASSDLFVDCLYQGGRRGNSSDDPLHLLLPVSNQGGSRIVGKKHRPKLIVLTTGLDDPDWPDEIDKEIGIFTYFGDNKKPGHELHDTPRYGNLLLKYIFDHAHGDERNRARVPPVLIFARGGTWRDVVFLGLAVPSAANLDANDDLVAVWKLRNGSRFQNYRAKFTVLDAPVITRQWILEVVADQPLGPACPESWRAWVERGIYKPLKAPRSLEYRTREEQLPADPLGKAIIERIHTYFSDDPYRFEACAARIAEMMLPTIAGNIDMTRAVRDGGRDATGRYRIGEGDSAVLVEFALEAKCYAQNKSVSVKELSRLISRLRHRQFGILVTTSFVAAQAYREVKEDQHPVVMICAADIARLLIRHGIGTLPDIDSWLSAF